MKAIVIIMLAAVPALTACSSKDKIGVEDNTPVAIQFFAGIDGAQTRAEGTSWDEGDNIGISCNSPGSTNYSNKKYVTSDGSGTFNYSGAGKAIFFQGSEDVTFSAYYPFAGTDGATGGVITCSTTNQANSKGFDFLFDSGVTTSRSDATNNSVPVNFTFKHKMTRLVLKIKTDVGFAATQVTDGTYYLSSITHEGEFNQNTGETNLTGTQTTNWQINATPVDGSDNVRTYSIILFPQQLASTFKATIESVDYTSVELSNTLRSGNSYEYTITIKKTGIAVSNCTISAWGTGTTGTGSVEIN